jgi:Fe-S-cluster containining protein
MRVPIASEKNTACLAEAMDNLARIFAAMDADYERAALAHGFVCRGCDDNCCRTRFYHHTLVEYLYLRQGLQALPAAERERVADLAVQVAMRQAAAPSEAVMCPLNAQGRCLLYAHRPMICRLHGIPHLLRRPDGRRQEGPGCGDFDRQCGAAAQSLLDRTPLYSALAELERELRRRLGFGDKIRMTIAQMVIEKPTVPDGGESDHEIY